MLHYTTDHSRHQPLKILITGCTAWSGLTKVKTFVRDARRYKHDLDSSSVTPHYIVPVFPALYSLHQTERNEATARLGGVASQASGRVPRIEGERPRETGRLRLQATFPQVLAKVGFKPKAFGAPTASCSCEQNRSVVSLVYSALLLCVTWSTNTIAHFMINVNQGAPTPAFGQISCLLACQSSI